MKFNWKPKTKIDSAAIKAVKLLQSKGFQAFWVGGIVRNILLKRNSDNVDIATDAKPDEIENIFSQAGFNTKIIGKQFGSIIVIIDSVLVEITTFRSEGRYSDKRHPDRVEFIGDYLKDAKRRDFTVNALYFDPVKKELFDPANGLKDLKGQLLRFVGDPKKRIDEDALRMLRGVRLATQLGGFSAGGGPASGWKLEKNSFAAIKTRAKYIQGISGERVKAELDKILLSENRAKGLRLLQAIGLLKFISPELDALKKVFHKSKFYHLEGDVLAHTLLVVEALNLSDLNLKYAALFHDVGKISTAKRVLKPEGWVNSFKGHVIESVRIFKQFADKYHFPRKDKNLITWLIAQHDQKKVFFNSKPEQQVSFAMQNHFDLLLDIWQADNEGNVKKPENNWYRKPRQAAYKLGLALLNKIGIRNKLIAKLARGGLIMKYGQLKPGQIVGQKIDEVKVRIVLGRIKNEKDLKNYLST